MVGRGQHQTARDAAQEALSLYQQTHDRAGQARALCELAARADEQGDSDQARAYAEAACQQARAAEDGPLLGTTLARLLWFLPPPDRRAVLDQAVHLLTQAGDHQGLTDAYASAAYLALKEDSLREAVELLDLAKCADERIDSPFSTMIISGNLGLAHLFAGDLARSRESFQHQLRLCLRHAFRYGAPEGLIGLAALSAAEGQPERAAQLLGSARTLGYPEPGDQPIYDRLERDYFAAAQARLGETAWRRAEKSGALWSFEDAIAHALSNPR